MSTFSSNDFEEKTPTGDTDDLIARAQVARVCSRCGPWVQELVAEVLQLRKKVKQQEDARG